MLSRWRAGCLIELRQEYSLSPLLNSDVESLGVVKNIMKNSREEIVSTQMTFLATMRTRCEVLAYVTQLNHESMDSRLKTGTRIAHKTHATVGICKR